jgi:hypothetical protein
LSFILVEQCRFETGRIGYFLQVLEVDGRYLAQGDAQRPDLIPIGLFRAVLLQLTKNRHRMHRQFGALDRIPRLAAQSRALGCGHLSNIVSAFKQQDVFLSSPGQRISDTTADGSTANDDEFGVSYLFPFRFHI